MTRSALFRLALVPYFTTILLLASPSLAQQPPGFDPNQMQEMMKRFQDPAAMQKLQQQAEAAQKCMEEVDEKQLDALRARAEAARDEIDELCAAGKKNEALKRGLALSHELRGDATLQKIQECSKGIGDMLRDMPGAQAPDLRGLETDKVPTDDDICS